MNEWVTSREFAEALGVSEYTVKRMCRSGQLTCAPISGKLNAKRFKWRVHRNAMNRFLEPR